MDKPAALGDVFVHHFQEGYERMDKERRQSGDADPRAVLWDDATRTLVASIVTEVITESERRSEERIVRVLGVTPSDHAKQHEGLDELIPWIKAQRQKTQAQAEFWQRLKERNLERAISWLMWLAVIAVLLGLTPAWEIARRTLGLV